MTYVNSLLSCTKVSLALTCLWPVIAAAGPLPGGASSLNESHENWQLACVDEASSVTCAVIQTQINPETGQQILAMELRPDGDGGLSGALVLPFGLALSQGIAVGIGDQEAGAVLGFTTCLPVGCIVPVSFDASTIEALVDLSGFTITASINDSGDPINFAVGLQGLKSAAARMQEILVE